VTSSALLPSLCRSRPVRGRRPSERERDYLKPAGLAAVVDVKQDVQGKRLINASNANLLMVQGSTHSSFIYIVHACSLHCRTSDRCAPVIHSVKMKS
jgi:hypothetical protein